MRAVLLAGLFVVSSYGTARATNFQVPAGVAGTLVFSNSRFSDGGNAPVPAEFGIVKRNAAGEAQYVKLTLNYADSSGTPFYRTPVSGGEVFELYLRRNAAGAAPSIPPQTFSSDPTKNTGIDPAVPEHTRFVTFAGLPNYWNLEFDQFNHTSDTAAMWTGYDVDIAFFNIRIDPACNGTTVPCPDPNVITSNHGLSIPSLGRDIFRSVLNVASKIGPSIGASDNMTGKHSYSCVNARIDNATWSLAHESIDFTVQHHARNDGGCSPSDGDDFSGPHFVKQLELKRFHRPKYDFMSVSSFGVGVFSEFDMNLTIYPGSSGQETSIVLFDPRSDAPPINFYETSTADADSAVDGLYHDRTTRAYRSLVLLNASGARTSDPRAATKARLTKLNGESFGFEIINTQGGTTPAFLAGRLTDLRDRNGNQFTLVYFYPANATDADLAFNRMGLWMISQLIDMNGASIFFDYDVSPSTGRLYIAHALWLEGTVQRQIDYSYSPVSSTSGEEPDRLNGVTYPNSDHSTFQRTWDAATQTWKIELNDVAEGGNGQNHLFAYVTGLFYVTSDGATHNQPPGLIRRVVNADGERAYQNWQDPNNGDTTYFAEGTGGTGTRLSRLRTTSTGAVVEIAHATTVPSDPLLATYTLDETYVPNSMGLFGSITNALNQVTSLVRDAVGNITGVTSPDGKTTSTTVNADQRVTRQTDPLGIVTNMTYDAASNLLSTVTAAGTPRQATWQYTYNSRGLMLTATNPLGAVTDYAYDANGRLTSISDPADVAGGTRPVRKFEYDAFGRRTAEIDQANRRTTFTYDLRGRVVTTTHPDGSTTKIVYGTGPFAGMMTAQIDRNGISTAYGYDQTRRLIRQTSSGNQPNGTLDHTIQFIPGRYLIASEINDGSKTQRTYDFKDRETQKVAFATGTKSLTYKRSWDGADRLSTETDPYGHRTYYVYDAKGLIIRKVWEMVPNAIASGTNIATLARVTTANPNFVIVDQGYDAAGRLTSQVNERGHTKTHSYDELGRRITTVDASGTPVARTTTFQYDANNNLTAEVGPRATKTFTYTRRGLLASQTEASGRTEAATSRRTYTLTEAIATMTNAAGGVTTFTYSTTDDYVTSVRDPGGFVTSMTYDRMGHVLTRTDPNGLVTKLTYDGRYRKLTETDGLNLVTSTDYDDNLTGNGGIEATPIYATPINAIGFGANATGHASRIGNPAAEPKVVVADGLGRKVLEIDPLGNSTRISYDTVVNGFVEVKTTNALGKVTTLRQDTRGNTREAVDPDGNVTKNSYDPAGNLLSTRAPTGVGVDCTYNELGQRTSCTNTGGDKTSWVYDADGNVTSTTDPLGNISTCQYDARNRKTSCTDRLGGVTSFTYDANSNLLTERDTQGGTTTYTYDARDLQTTATYPDSTGGTDKVTMAYDAGRRLQSTTDQNGNVITMTYDAANRVTKTTYPGAVTDTFTYDAASRVTTAVSGRYGVTTTRSYDGDGRLTAENTNVTSRDFRVSYGYDALNRITTLTYPDSSQVFQTYGIGRDLVTETKLGTFSLAKYTYDSGNRITSTTFGNTQVETRTFRTGDNGTAQISAPAAGTLVYTYDRNGNKLTETGTAANGNQTFGYDKENRLTSFSGPSLTQAWTLSGEGDWTSTTRNSVVENRTHNAAHELTAVGATALTYDGRGNMTRDNRSNNMVWDVSNRLKQYQKSGGPTVDFLYDAFGRRVGRKIGTSTVVYVFALDTVVAEYKDGVLTSKYVTGPDGGDDYLAYVNGGRIFWYSKDPLHTIKAITNETGAVVERYRYTPYGQRTILSSTGTVLGATTVANAIGFTGRPHDVDTGLVDFRSRQYDPLLGRFISRDSAGYVDGLSLYRAYFVPNRTDSTGHGLISGLKAIGGAALDGLKDAGSAAVDIATDIGKGSVNVVSSVGSGITGAAGLVGDIGTAAWDGAKYFGTELWTGTEYLGNALWDGAQYLGDKLADGAMYAARGVAWAVRGVKSFASAYWHDFVDSWKMVGAAAWEMAKPFGQMCWDAAMIYYKLFTLHPLDSLKAFVNYLAEAGNFEVAALSFVMVTASVVGGRLVPFGGPTTWIGIGLGLIGWALGGDAPQVHILNGGLVWEFPNSPCDFGGYSRTYGRAIIYSGSPDDLMPDGTTKRQHEYQHVFQYGALSELYFPAHLEAQGISYAATGEYNDANWLEIGPYNTHTPWPVIPKIPRWE